MLGPIGIGAMATASFGGIAMFWSNVRGKFKIYGDSNTASIDIEEKQIYN